MGKPNRKGTPSTKQRRGLVRPCLLLVGFVAAVATPISQAAGEKVTIVGASNTPLTVKFARSGSTGWRGRLDLIVQNHSDKPARVRMRFFPGEASQSPFVAFGRRHAGEGVTIHRIFPSTSLAPAVQAKSRTRVSVVFLVDAKTPLRRASGTLVVELVPAEPRRKVVKAASLASASVSTKATPAAQVTFEPTPVKMGFVRRYRVVEETGGELDVVLRGEGLDELAKGFSGAAASTRLFTDSGESLRATVQDLRATGDDEAQATIVLDDVGSVGAYKGKFPFLSGSQGTQLNVEVNVHDWFWLAFGIVVLGVALGWLLTHAAGIRRQKDLLRAGLIASIREYEAAAGESKPASFDLEDVLGPKPRYGPRVRCGPFPQDRTARELLCRIANARSEDDLKSDGESVARFIGAIGAWLEVEPHADALQALTDSPPADRGSREFADTLVAQDTEVLLGEAGDQPADRAAASALALRLREQAAVWKLAALLWSLQCELEAPDSGLTKAKRRELAKNDVDKVIKPRAKPDDSPTNRELRRSKERLRRAIARVERLRPGPVLPEVDEELEPEGGLLLGKIVERSGSVKYSMTGEESTVQKTGRGVRATILTWLARTDLVVAQGLSRDRALLAGIRTVALRAARYVGVRAARLARWLVGLVRRDADTPHAVLSLWTRRDVALTMIAVGVSSIAYTFTVYDSTWGGRDDYLTAFAAGFLGKVVVDWSDQFISKSLRVG